MSSEGEGPLFKLLQALLEPQPPFMTCECGPDKHQVVIKTTTCKQAQAVHSAIIELALDPKRHSWNLYQKLEAREN